MQFSIPFKVTSGASAGTYKTIAAIPIANTAGLRLRVRSIAIGPADAAPNDRNFNVALRRIASVSSGANSTTGTAINAVNVPKKDSGARNILGIADGSPAAYTNYTTEPTTYDTHPVWQDDYNDRGGIIKEWDERGAPKFLANQLLGLCVAPRAAFAGEVCGTIEVEEY